MLERQFNQFRLHAPQKRLDPARRRFVAVFVFRKVQTRDRRRGDALHVRAQRREVIARVSGAAFRDGLRCMAMGGFVSLVGGPVWTGRRCPTPGFYALNAMVIKQSILCGSGDGYRAGRTAEQAVSAFA